MRCHLSNRSFLAVFGAAFVLTSAIPFPLSADDDNYGPDWTVCQNQSLSPEERVASCTRIIQSGTLTRQDSSRAYDNRGVAWADLSNFEFALNDFSRSIQIDPLNGKPYYYRSKIYSFWHDTKRALVEIEKSIQTGFRSTDAYAVKGRYLEVLLRTDEALQSYSKAIEIDPNNIRALDRRADLLYLAGKLDLALVDQQALVELAPSDPTAWFGRGRIYQWQSNFAGAVSDFTQVLTLRPDAAATYQARAESYFSLGQYDAVRADCATAGSISPDYYGCGGYVARSYMMEGRIEQAIASLNEIVDVHTSDRPSDRAKNLLIRGAMKYALGHYESARDDFFKSLEGDPQNLYSILWLHLTSQRLGHAEKESMRSLTERHDIWPQPIIRYLLGQITEEQVLAMADAPLEPMRRQRAAEAQFYLGEIAALAGKIEDAQSHYEAAIAIGEAEVRIDLPGQQFFKLYKSHNDMEIVTAKAALSGGSL